MKPRSAGIYRVGDRLVVVSSSACDGMSVDNDFVEVLGSATDELAFGQSVRPAWVASLMLPLVSAQGKPPVLNLFDLRSSGALTRARVVQVFATIIQGGLIVAATRHEGPRNGFSGIEEIEGLSPGVSDGKLGRVILSALDRSR